MRPFVVSVSEQGEQRPQTAGGRLARSASVTGIATLASRVLDLARDQVLAALFGAGNDMDAFIVAFRIPNLVRDLFAEGAMSAAFVPAFTRELTRGGKDAAWRLGNNVINALLVVTGVLVALGIVFAGPLVRMYAGDFASVPGKLELTVQLTRITLPFLTMVALAAAAMGMLNSLHHYFLPALAPAMFNLATIVLATPIVQLLFERGHFVGADTIATSAALRVYAVGLVGYSTVRIVSPAFYAIGRSRVPVMVSAGAIGANVIASVVLVNLMGFSGLALGTSIAAVTNAVALVWLLQRQLGGLHARRLAGTVAKIALAALVMGAVAGGLERVMMRALPGAHVTVQAVRLAVEIGGALAGLGVMARLLRPTELVEFGEVVSMFRARVVRS
ncbi:MAG: polysaccharide biosynthesis C-terminal domain-containing protein [Acidobacteria bacterium]|nr:polysaccharide biosynthesis C-terminal domain-containing protein [Acidobacteriota bacterium]